VSGRCAYNPGPQAQLATLDEAGEVPAAIEKSVPNWPGRDVGRLGTGLRDHHPHRGDGPRRVLALLSLSGLREGGCWYLPRS
jgi:hypothetical protein